MKTETEYKIEFGKQVEKYLKKSGLDINDFARLIRSNTDNVRDIMAGNVGLTIGKMVNIAHLFGQVYYNFANPNYPIPAKNELTEKIKDIIDRRKRIGKKTIDKNRILAHKLDKFIMDGLLNTPVTSKIIHYKMGKDVKNKKTSEITNLLGKSPRNKFIQPIDIYHKQKVYIHKDYAQAYRKLSKEELEQIILQQEERINNKD
ncbi:hypothetical protein ACL9RF_01110 [Sphingobacterium sp. Mn56C]|uniref:hypothetical protein n=1 Tax=Sphingobacterium sp. Mn56C TaxID=3395261 RepID=UPI003BDFA0D5